MNVMNVRKLSLTGFLFVAFAVFGLVSQAQASKWGMEFEFFSDTSEKAFDVVATPDGGSVVVGEYYGHAGTYDRAYAAKINKCGEVILKKWYFYDYSYQHAGFYSVDRARGDTQFYYATGSIYYPSKRRLFLVKLDSNLDVVWSRDVHSGGSYFSGNAVAAIGTDNDANADGGCTVVYSKLRPGSTTDQDLWVIKFDENGNDFPQYLYGAQHNTDVYEMVSKEMIQTVDTSGNPDGYIGVCYHGYGTHPNWGACVEIIRTDLAFNLVNGWGSTGQGGTLLNLDDQAYDVPWEIQQTSSGDFIIVGVREKREIRVIRLDRNGVVTWAKRYCDGTYCPPGNDPWLGNYLEPSVAEIGVGTGNHGFVVTGSRGCYNSTSPSRTWTDAWIFKVDPDNGACLWANRFGYLSDYDPVNPVGTNMDDRFLGVDASIDPNIDASIRGVVTSGLTRGWGQPTDPYRNLIAMVDGDGNCCSCDTYYESTECVVTNEEFSVYPAEMHREVVTYDVVAINPYVVDLDPACEFWPCCSDYDNDGISDPVDNCCATYNPGQRDTDSDGYGNMCDCDVNNSDVVDASDMAVLLLDWDSTGPDLNTDFNGDEIVNSSDVAILLNRWHDTVPFE